MKGVGPGLSVLGRAFPFASSDINVFASVMTTLFMLVIIMIKPTPL